MILQIVILSFLIIPSIHAQSDSIQLIQVNSEACDITKDNKLFKTRISAIQCKNDTTLITVAFTEMCGQEWKGQIAIKNDSLNLSYHKGIIPEIFCTCCYSITYTLLGYNEKQHLLLFRGQPIQFSEAEYFIEQIKRDTLEDGSIRIARYLDDVLQFESIGTKGKRIIRRYYKDDLLIFEKETLLD